MKKINEMMISAYLKGMSKLNAFKDNESGEVNMVAIVHKHTLQNIHSDINKKEHTEKHDRKNKRCLNDRHSALFVLDVFAFLPEYPVQFNTDHPYKNLCLCVCIFCLSRISPQQKAVSCFHINNSL